MSERDPLLPTIKVGNKYTSESNDEKDKKGHNSIHQRFSYVAISIIGVGMLLPWNFFINADRYFDSKLKSIPKDMKLFESAFSICSQVPCGIALMLNLYLTDRTSRKVRVLWTLVISTLCFILTTILVNINTECWTSSFFGITLATVMVINFCSGIFQGTILGIAGALGRRYVQAAIVGMSAAGTFTSIINLISLTLDHDIKVDATIYFTVATLVVCLCMVMYLLMIRSTYVKERLAVSGTPRTSEAVNVGVMDMVRYIYPAAFSVMWSFAVTLSLMPAILSKIVSVDAADGSAWTNKYFSSLTVFILFNIGDLSGRILSGTTGFINKWSNLLPVLCVFRIVFIPLFALCNYQPRNNLPVVFNHDLYPVLFNVLFAVSNGYLCSKCMMYGPELAPEYMMERAGAAMQLFLTLGTVIGAALSMLFVGLI